MNVFRNLPLALLTVPSCLVLGLCLMPGWGLSAAELVLPAGPVIVQVDYTPSGASTYTMTFDGLPADGDVQNGSYAGWCVEDNHKPTYFQVNLFDADGGGLPPSAAAYSASDIPAVSSGRNLLGDSIPWDRLNYLLNHKQGSLEDIQAAIWTLIWGQAFSFTYSATSALMVEEAWLEGAGFEPAPGEIEGVLLYVDGIGWEEWQDTVIEVVVPPDSCVDEDGDGFVVCARSGEDCDDHDPAIHPGAVERCDGIDNDCDGSIDEGLNADGPPGLVVAYHDAGGSLSKVETGTGATTPLLGPAGALSIGASGITATAVRSDGALFAVDADGSDSLYRLDLQTGVSVRVGGLTGRASNIQAMDFAPETAALHGFVPGMLYGVSIDGFEGCGPNCLFRIDPETAQTTVSGPLAGNQIRGLSFNPVTGELWAYDPGGKVLSVVSTTGQLAYQLTIPNSHQDGHTGVDTAFSLAHGCDGELYTVDIAYGVLLWIDVDSKQAYWVGAFGSAASAGGSFQAQGLDALNTGACGCAVAEPDPATPTPEPTAAPEPSSTPTESPEATETAEPTEGPEATETPEAVDPAAPPKIDPSALNAILQNGAAEEPETSILGCSQGPTAGPRAWSLGLVGLALLLLHRRRR